MLRFLIRRLLGALVILLVISAVTFFLFYAIPRNPALLACGKGVCTDDQLAVVEHNLGIDEPVPVQYWHYMVGIFAGRDFPAGHCPAPCLGFSFRDNRPVLDTILDRLPTTISLTDRHPGWLDVLPAHHGPPPEPVMVAGVTELRASVEEFEALR